MLAYGRNVAIELLKKPEKIRKIYLQEHFSDKRLDSLLENCKLPIVFLSKRELDRLAKENHQGIMIDVRDYEYCPFEKLPLENEDCFLVLLDHLEDPHNLGAIIRTCEAAGVDGILLPKDRQASVNATVMKTSAGTIENVKISQVTNLAQTIKELQKRAFWVVGTAMEDSVDYRTIDYSGKIALVIGNEASGMTRLVRESCDFVAKIPMKGKVNSLNASVAAGIMIYEVFRNRK